MYRLLLCTALVLSTFITGHAQNTPGTLTGNHQLEEVKIRSPKRVEQFVFSSFEKKVHISLNPHHDEYRYTAGPTGKPPDRFTAATFLHNDTTAISLYKIEGRALPFDTANVQVKVAVIQRGLVVASWQLLPGMIVHNRFTIETGAVPIGTGEFYVLYVCKLRRGGAFYITVNPKKESARFSFNYDEDNNPVNTRSFFPANNLPAPQFKIYAFRTE